MQKNQTIPTNQGKLTIPEIMDALTYSSYEANRTYGMSHEQLLSIGIGNDAMKLKYESTISTNEETNIEL